MLHKVCIGPSLYSAPESYQWQGKYSFHRDFLKDFGEGL